MTWLLFDTTTGAQIGALHTTEPSPAGGQGVAVVPASAMTTPPLTIWSPSLKGFVDTPHAVPVSRLKFQLLFTAAERTAIRGSTNTMVQDFIELSKIAADIDLTHEVTIAGVNYLESVGLIGAGRAAQVLAGVAPA
jgi:hypothetical protein